MLPERALPVGRFVGPLAVDASGVVGACRTWRGGRHGWVGFEVALATPAHETVQALFVGTGADGADDATATSFGGVAPPATVGAEGDTDALGRGEDATSASFDHDRLANEAFRSCASLGVPDVEEHRAVGAGR